MAIILKEQGVLEYNNGDTLPIVEVIVGTRARNADTNEWLMWDGSAWITSLNTGPPGEDGMGYVIKGSTDYATYSGMTHSPGDIWIMTDYRAAQPPGAGTIPGYEIGEGIWTNANYGPGLVYTNVGMLVGAPGTAAGVGTPTSASGPLAVTATGPDDAKIFNFTIPPGADGVSPTVGVFNPTITGGAGTNAAVTNKGDAVDALFQFTIPRGDKGEPGTDGSGVTIQGSDTIININDKPGVAGDMWISTTAGTDDFGGTVAPGDGVVYDGTDWGSVGPIRGPKGDIGNTGATPTITVGTVIDGPAVKITDVGTGSDSIFNFELKKGTDGVTPTVGIHSTVTGLAGTNAIVSDEDAGVNLNLKFTIPRGDKGTTGNNGTAAGVGTATAITGPIGVTTSGPDTAKVFEFSIPAGSPGTDGITPTVAVVPSIITGLAGTSASVQDLDGGANMNLKFTIPRGDTGGIGGTGDDGTAAGVGTPTVTSGTLNVTATGPDTAKVFNFTIPPGASGDSATISGATASGLPAGSEPTISLGGSSMSRTFAFGIPAGATGSNGTTPTVAVIPTVTTGLAGTDASVVDNDAGANMNLKFTIPRGDKGAPGDPASNTWRPVKAVNTLGTTETLELKATAPLTIGESAGVVTYGIPKASSGANGYLSSTDWNTFNNKTSNSGTVTAIGTSGAILGGIITDSGVISHSTANGYKHIPADGATGKVVGWSAEGTGQWVDADGHAHAYLPLDGGDMVGDGRVRWFGYEENLLAITGDEIRFVGGSGMWSHSTVLDSSKLFVWDNSTSTGLKVGYDSIKVAQSLDTAVNAITFGYNKEVGIGGYFTNGIALTVDGDGRFIGKAVSDLTLITDGGDTLTTKSYVDSASGGAFERKVGSSATYPGIVLSDRDNTMYGPVGADSFDASKSSVSNTLLLMGAVGDNSAAFGLNNYAKGVGSIVAGWESKAYAKNSVAMGNHCITGNNSVVVDGGVALGFYAEATGIYSFATGNTAKAQGRTSIAIGHEVTASADFATAMGKETDATGYNSTTLGEGTAASGISSLATGLNTFAIGDYSASFGYDTRAEGKHSMAIGIGTEALAHSSFATGFNTEASNTAAVAFGFNTTASGIYSFSGGEASLASAKNSFAFGAATTASLNNATAFGENTTASGRNSLALGFGSIASNLGTTAMGGYTVADQTYSTAAGYGTKTGTYGSFVTGKYNVGYDHGAFEVGWGADDVTRENLFTVSTTGLVYANIADVADIIAEPTTSKVLVTKEYVDGLAGSGVDMNSITRSVTSLHTIPTAGTAIVNWDQSIISNSNFPMQSSKSRLFVTEAGKYLLTGYISIRVNSGDGPPADATGHYVITVKNASNVVLNQSEARITAGSFTDGTTTESARISVILDMAANSYITISATTKKNANYQKIDPTSSISMVQLKAPKGADGIGIAPGGDTNQILAKKSDTSYDTEWVDPSGLGTFVPIAGGSSSGSYMTGDLYVGTMQAGSNVVVSDSDVTVNYDDVAGVVSSKLSHYKLNIADPDGYTDYKNNRIESSATLAIVSPLSVSGGTVVNNSCRANDFISNTYGTYNSHMNINTVGWNLNVNIDGATMNVGGKGVFSSSVSATSFIANEVSLNNTSLITGADDFEIRNGEGDRLLDLNHSTPHEFYQKVIGVYPTATNHLATAQYVLDNAGTGGGGDQTLQEVCDTSGADPTTTTTITAEDFILNSDVRLKDNIDDLKAYKLRPVSFDWIDSKVSDIGFIAQEVEEFYPEVVTTDEDGFKRLSYSKITAINAARINELEDENSELKDKIELLEERLDRLEVLMNNIL